MPIPDPSVKLAKLEEERKRLAKIKAVNQEDTDDDFESEFNDFMGQMKDDVLQASRNYTN